MIRITRTKPRRLEDFMALCRPYTASQVAKACNLLTPGIDWMKCSKGHMGSQWACDSNTLHKREWQDVALADIEQALRFGGGLLWDEWRDWVWKSKLPRNADKEAKAARFQRFEFYMLSKYPGLTPKHLLYVIRHDL